jgi:hypothetical protein
LKAWAVALLLVASPVGAAEWRAYDNAAFGYAIDLPPGFGIEMDNGERLVLSDGPKRLEVFGLDLSPLRFEEAVALAMQSSVEEGFALVAQTTTPQQANWSGVEGANQLAVGVVPLCGSNIAGYELRYQEIDGVAMQAVIARLQASLRKTGSC